MQLLDEIGSATFISGDTSIAVVISFLESNGSSGFDGGSSVGMHEKPSSVMAPFLSVSTGEVAFGGSGGSGDVG